ncbi:hypothetical protein [Bacillus sp. B-jedd]|uniref:hypothetical protein n=1 Tax=Bacillus sp. B-jedd TaxID=1476857 RepID=UPI0005155DC1|nr:hypothetical protein [Bacillus sp. B-jedd]CEG26030.1 hypothetical protein BN1002_00868 [Bacillus sp. B-jedd]
MSWVSFLSGALVTAFAYGLFIGSEQVSDPEEDEDELEVSDYSGRNVTLSCQTCRKLKRHREVQPNLYQCSKCKRQVDLRIS